MQDTVYASLFQKHKRIFHRRIAEALEREFPETVASEPDVLAWHFTEADKSLKAIPYWCRAGEAAIARSAMTEARRQFEHGEDLINKLSKGRASLTSQDSATLDSLELELLGGLKATLWAPWKAVVIRPCHPMRTGFGPCFEAGTTRPRV